MNIKLFLNIIIIIFYLVTPLHSENKKVKIGIEGDFFPWNYLGDDGKFKGSDIDFANLICLELSLDCTFVQFKWENLIPSLVKNDIDLIISSISITTARKKSIDFSIGYMSQPSIFMAKAALPISTLKISGKINLDDEKFLKDYRLKLMHLHLNGKNIGVIKDSNQNKFLKKYFDEVNKIIEYENISSMKNDLDNSKLDIVFGKTIELEALTESGVDLKSFGPIFLGEELNDIIAIGINKKNNQLKNLLNEAIINLRKNDDISKISEKWFNRDISM